MVSNERLTISLPIATKKALEDLAEAKGITISAATKQVLAKGLVVEAVVGDGGEVIFKDQNGEGYVLSNRPLPGNFNRFGIDNEMTLVRVATP